MNNSLSLCSQSPNKPPFTPFNLIFPIRRNPLAYMVPYWQTIGAERLRHVLLGVVRWKCPGGLSLGPSAQSQFGQVGHLTQ